MKVGMPALVEYTSIDRLIELCLRLNLDFVELNMNMPYNFIENIDPYFLKKAAEEYNINFTMHMPDDADIGSFYQSVRKGYVKLFSDTLNWCGKAGIKLINMHVIEGAKMTLPDKKVYIYDQYYENYEKNFIDSIKLIQSSAQENDVIVAIENSHNFGKIYIQKVLDKALVYRNIKLTWDTGHDRVSNFTDKKYLMEHTEKIAHMHFHDAKGTSDHLIPFEGELNIYDLVNFARQKNIGMLIEVKTAEALSKSVEILREKNLIEKLS